jgi:hypothetical protein
MNVRHQVRDEEMEESNDMSKRGAIAIPDETDIDIDVEMTEAHGEPQKPPLEKNQNLIIVD